MLGVSFDPAADEVMRAKRTKANRVPEAIRTISTRLPRIVGAASVAPMQLLSGMGGMGSGAAMNPILQSIMQMVQQGQHPGGALPPELQELLGGGPSLPPMPKVTPGDGPEPLPSFTLPPPNTPRFSVDNQSPVPNRPRPGFRGA